MYSFNGRVRYSETDSEEYLTLEGIIDYFQDAAIFHTSDLGLSTDKLIENKCAWMVCSWQIEINRYPKHGERIAISTWAYGFRSFMGERNCLIATEDGEELVKAGSVWSYMDLEQQRPIKVPDEVIDMYGIEKPLDMEYKPRKIPVPKEGGESFPYIVVERHHIDSLGHVNNGQYLKMAMEYRQITDSPKSFRVEYKKQAHFGDKIFPVRYEEEDREVISLNTEDGGIYAVVEITKQVEKDNNE